MATGISSPLALGGLYPSVDGGYVAANGRPFSSVSNAESALNGFPSKLSESCVGLTVLVADENDPDYPKAKEYWVQPKGTTPETYGLVEKGVGTTDYNDLDNKPTIGDGTNTALPIVGNVKVSASTASGSTAGVTVTPGQNAGEIEMRFTLPQGDDAYEVYLEKYKEEHSGSTDGAMSKDAWLASLKGADGADGAPGHNPCLGRFPAVPNPMPNGQIGDYLYVDITTTDPNTQEETTTTTVYHYGSNGWDSGAVIDAEHPTFASRQAVTSVHIKDLNGDDDPDAQGVLSAEAGAELAGKTNEVNVGSAAGFAEAIALVPQNMKKAGLTVTYYDTAKSEWVTKKYVGTSLDGWETMTNWKDIVSVSPLKDARNDYLQYCIEGKPRSFTPDPNSYRVGNLYISGDGVIYERPANDRISTQLADFKFLPKGTVISCDFRLYRLGVIKMVEDGTATFTGWQDNDYIIGEDALYGIMFINRGSTPPTISSDEIADYCSKIHIELPRLSEDAPYVVYLRCGYENGRGNIDEAFNASSINRTSNILSVIPGSRIRYRIETDNNIRQAAFISTYTIDGVHKSRLALQTVVTSVLCNEYVVPDDVYYVRFSMRATKSGETVTNEPTVSVDKMVVRPNKLKGSTNKYLKFAHTGAVNNPTGIKMNSKMAFKKAGELGYDGVECDVHQTSDGHLVVNHDDTINGTEIKAMTLEEFLSNTFPETEYVTGDDCVRPTLEDVVDICRQYDMTLIIDVKSYNDLGKYIYDVVDLLRSRGMEDRAIFQPIHKTMSDMMGAVSSMLVTPYGNPYGTGGVPDIIAAIGGRLNYGVSFEGTHSNAKQYATDAHNNGLTVFMFTAENATMEAAWRANGADVVITLAEAPIPTE